MVPELSSLRPAGEQSRDCWQCLRANVSAFVARKAVDPEETSMAYASWRDHFTPIAIAVLEHHPRTTTTSHATTNVHNPPPPLANLRPHLVHHPLSRRPNPSNQLTPPPQARTPHPLPTNPQPPHLPRLLRAPAPRPSEHPAPPRPALLHARMGLPALRPRQARHALQAGLRIPPGGREGRPGCWEGWSRAGRRLLCCYVILRRDVEGLVSEVR